MVHETTAAAAVLRVVQKRNSGLLQQRNGITLMGLIRGCDSIAVGISQPVQPVPAMPLMLREMADLLLTPWRAVGF